MNVSVVIPNLNGAKYLSECINSLLMQSVKCQIVVVDNGSTDSSMQVLKTYGKKVMVLPQTKNLGFAGGVNVGIKYALKNKADYIALFNNDAIADRNWLKNLLAVMVDHKDAGIVTCKFMQFDKKHIDSTGEFITTYGISFSRGRNEIDMKQYDTQTNIFAASGGASLYRSNMFKQIGLFDENFFAYFEDVDLSFRAQLAGWKIKYVPSAIAYHHIGATSSSMGNFTIYNTAKNLPLLYLKNFPSYLFIKYLPFAIFWYMKIFTARSLRGGSIAFLKGFFVALYVSPKKLVERWHIQKTRKVSIKYIDRQICRNRPPKPPKKT